MLLHGLISFLNVYIVIFQYCRFPVKSNVLGISHLKALRKACSLYQNAGGVHKPWHKNGVVTVFLKHFNGVTAAFAKPGRPLPADLGGSGRESLELLRAVISSSSKYLSV